MVAGLFGMFFLGALYLQRVLGYDAIEIGLAFLPVAVLIGALSLGFSARLNMRFGARATLLPGLALIVAGLLLFARAPVDGQLPDRRPAGDGPARHRRRALLPVADDARDVGRHAERLRASPPGSSTRPCRWVARSAWRSSPRSRRRAPTACCAGGDSTASALTGGYHLAFLIGSRPGARRDRRRRVVLRSTLPGRGGGGRGGVRGGRARLCRGGLAPTTGRARAAARRTAAADRRAPRRRSRARPERRSPSAGLRRRRSRPRRSPRG